MDFSSLEDKADPSGKKILPSAHDIREEIRHIYEVAPELRQADAPHQRVLQGLNAMWAEEVKDVTFLRTLWQKHLHRTLRGTFGVRKKRKLAKFSMRSQMVLCTFAPIFPFLSLRFSPLSLSLFFFSLSLLFLFLFSFSFKKPTSDFP